jgi:hypothetical protein
MLPEIIPSNVFTVILNSYSRYILKCKNTHYTDHTKQSVQIKLLMKAMKAKHDAAHKMLLQIQKTARAGETLNDVTRQTLLNWCEWFFSHGIVSGKIY